MACYFTVEDKGMFILILVEMLRGGGSVNYPLFPQFISFSQILRHMVYRKE